MWKIIVGLGLATCAFAHQGFSNTLNTLKNIQVIDGKQVDLLFDGKIQPSQVKVEYVGDIVQLSLQGVSVYPAKILSVNGADLTKVFSYQYAPQLVRTRLSVKEKAEAYKDRIQLNYDGKLLSIRVNEAVIAGTDKIGQSAAAPEVVSVTNEESALLKKVLQAETPAEAALVIKKKEAETPLKASKTSGAAVGRDSSISLVRPMIAMGTVFMVLLGFLWFLKRVKSGDFGKSGMGKSAIGKFLAQNLGTKSKVIETVATHHLGPKKSISVVKVCGRTMVLGVTQDQINLIAEFTGEGKDATVNTVAYEDMDLDAFMKAEPSLASKVATPAMQTQQPVRQATAVQGNRDDFSFNDLLKNEEQRPQEHRTAVDQKSASSIRAQIRSKVEGFKPL